MFFRHLDQLQIMFHPKGETRGSFKTPLNFEKGCPFPELYGAKPPKVRKNRFNPTHNDARYLGEVVVYYPLHPFFGRGKLPVCRRRGIGHVEHVEVQIDGVRQAVPVWMTDEQFCHRLTIGFEPACSLAALLELLSLVRSTEL